MSLDRQIRFMVMWRAEWAKGNWSATVQMASAIIASLRRLQKFEREKK